MSSTIWVADITSGVSAYVSAALTQTLNIGQGADFLSSSGSLDKRPFTFPGVQTSGHQTEMAAIEKAWLSLQGQKCQKYKILSGERGCSEGQISVDSLEQRQTVLTAQWAALFASPDG